MRNIVGKRKSKHMYVYRMIENWCKLFFTRSISSKTKTTIGFLMKNWSRNRSKTSPKSHIRPYVYRLKCDPHVYFLVLYRVNIVLNHTWIAKKGFESTRVPFFMRGKTNIHAMRLAHNPIGLYYICPFQRKAVFSQYRMGWRELYYLCPFADDCPKSR